MSVFLKRKDLFLRKPQDVALNCIYALNKTDVSLFFENYFMLLKLIKFIMKFIKFIKFNLRL